MEVASGSPVAVRHVAEVLAEGGSLDDPADYAAELLRGRVPVTPDERSLRRRIGRGWWIALGVVVGLVLLLALFSGTHTVPVPPDRPGPSIPTLPQVQR